MTSNLTIWLQDQGLSVRQLAEGLDVPLKTVQDWLYQRYKPSPENQGRLEAFMACTHHWVIERPAGPTSEGVCQRCGEKREFTNSVEPTSIWTYRSKAHTSKRNGTIDHT